MHLNRPFPVRTDLGGGIRPRDSREGLLLPLHGAIAVGGGGGLHPLRAGRHAREAPRVVQGEENNRLHKRLHLKNRFIKLFRIWFIKSYSVVQIGLPTA